MNRRSFLTNAIFMTPLLFVNAVSARGSENVCKFYSEEIGGTPMVNPMTFISGSAEEVESAYDHLRIIIEREGVGERSGYYFVNDDYVNITKYQCAKEVCDGRDILVGINTCFSESGAPNNCTPLAVVRDKKVYCLLRSRESKVD
ncbi:hypothetical protein [Rhizobium skierniewicense]|uniref:hypothetical protein n=1 Tax=Rhizobium skierniewicense TaxID=984260 RepID=UPI00157330F3|nr:hypothetical protein [Rhizobium skierniewicense]NTF33964.1 hypothetical protein [Rhizobium skierniewicense]